MAMKLFSLMETAFDRYDETIHVYLSKTFNNLGLEYTNTQVFGIIYNGIRGVLQNAMFYIEDALSEQNVFTATRKKSLYSLAKISGYEPYFGAAATGTLMGKSLLFKNTLSSDTATKIFIKNKTLINNKRTNLKYILWLPTDFYVFDITKPLVNHEFKIVQGSVVNNSYIASGFGFETIELNIIGLWDRDYFSVSVNGEEWEQAASIYDMTANGKEYCLTSGYGSSVSIMFGNNIYGRTLVEGDTVLIKYISHSGLIGNINVNDNAEFEFYGLGYDKNGVGVDLNEYMTLSLNSSISGGTNSDSVEIVKNMIGFNSRSLVLANENNFKLFFKRFSFIGNINLWSEDNSMTIYCCCLKNIKNYVSTNEDYFYINPDDFLLSNNEKNMIITTLDNSKKTFAGVNVEFKDPIIRRYAIICYLKCKNSYNKDIIKSNIDTIIATYFLNLKDNIKFIPKSDIIKTVLNNSQVSEQISSFDIDIISDMAESAFKTGYYYKYELFYNNGTYEYKPKKYMYEENNYPGLDKFGNIQLDNNMEIPLLNAGINYYPNKDSHDKNTMQKLEAIHYIFI